MDNILKDRLSLIATLGAGVVVGISGIYMYYKVNKCIKRELNQLSGTIDSLKREIEELKASSSLHSPNSLPSPVKKANSSSLSAHGSKYYSYSSLEDADDEYYDFSENEEIVGAWQSINGSEEDISKASNLEALLNDLDQQLDSDSSDKESIYFRMIEKEEHFDNAEFLWRLAKVSHLYGLKALSRGNADKRKELAFEAFKFAKKAYEMNQEDPEIHKWYAITIGSLGDYVGAQEKIANGFTFKEHVDKAIELKPSDPTLYYMLGRWCYEVAMLSWLERRLATTLFSSPPEATLEEAQVHLLKADKLRPDWKENLLFLAKAFIGEGDYANAISIIDRALKLPLNSVDDEVSHSELLALEYKYETYRVMGPN